MALTKASYSMITGAPVNVLDFGAVGDWNGTSGTDNLAAFNAAIASFPTTFDDSTTSFGGEILIPPGKYYLSGTLEINRGIILTGLGANYLNGSVVLVFADNKNGIFIPSVATSSTGKAGNAPVIQNLVISKYTTSGTTGNGIVMNYKAKVINCSVIGFRENGIWIYGNQAGTPSTNSNGWLVDSCELGGNGGNGLKVEGPDSNGGVGINILSNSNGGWGILESSFLGGTYIGCICETNTLGGYKSTSNSSRTVFVGCYTEPGQPPNDLAPPAMFISGLQGPGNTTQTNGINSDIDRISIKNFAAGNALIGYQQPNTSGSGLSFLDTQGLNVWSFNKAVGKWGYNWSNIGSISGFVFYDQTATTANGYARNITAGSYGIGSYYFGEANQMLLRTIGSSAPTSGNYLVGDIVYNSAPAPGGFIGFVCTTAGSPGTWKTFGAIST